MKEYKPCRGIGIASGHGCGKEVKANTRKHGLGNCCYPEWLLNSEAGREKMKKATIKAKKERILTDKRETKRKKEALMTNQDWIKLVQKDFNTYVRLSKEPTCISCGTDLRGRKFDAGHYRSVGSVPSLRFELDNCWPQCVPCNQHLSGNIVEYRIRLVRKLGEERVNWLEQDHPPKKYTIPELKELREYYKSKIKELK